MKYGENFMGLYLDRVMRDPNSLMQAIVTEFFNDPAWEVNAFRKHDIDEIRIVATHKSGIYVNWELNTMVLNMAMHRDSRNVKNAVTLILKDFATAVAPRSRVEYLEKTVEELQRQVEKSEAKCTHLRSILRTAYMMQHGIVEDCDLDRMIGDTPPIIPERDEQKEKQDKFIYDFMRGVFEDE